MLQLHSHRTSPSPQKLACPYSDHKMGKHGEEELNHRN